MEKSEGKTQQKTSDKEKKQHGDTTSFFESVTGRTVFFLQSLSFVLIVFFISGSFQEFLDSTLNFIILLTTIVCTMAALFTAVYTVITIFRGIRLKQKIFILHTAGLIVLFVLDVVFLVVARSVTLLTGGI